MPSTHNKDKPWDTSDIDKWKIEEFKPEDNKGGTFAEKSSFALTFPKYRETYLKSIWSTIKQALEKYHISCSLDIIEGTMTVSTTRKTYDPVAILKARDLIKLLARSVPAPEALKILQDGIASDIIKIGNIVRNKDRFIRRRQRIIGPQGTTLKALQILTETYILVQGNTVAVMGPYKGLKEVRRLVIDCMNNIHPIYNIKSLMVKRELAKNPNLANESWDRFLPKFKKRNENNPRKSTVTKNSEKQQPKPYTPFPPPPQKSKVDIEIETGQYFLSSHAKDQEKKKSQKLKQEAAVAAKREKKALQYIPLDED